MNVSKLKDIQAVIDSAKVRDDGKLEEFIRRSSPDSTDEEIAGTAKVATEVVEMVPIVLAAAAQCARELGLTSVVTPVLEHATRYFVNPVDLIPEMTQGMAGLLDDTYLTFRILENLNRGDPPLMEAGVRDSAAVPAEAAGNGRQRQAGRRVGIRARGRNRQVVAGLARGGAPFVRVERDGRRAGQGGTGAETMCRRAP